MFQIVTPENSQRITLNSNSGTAPSECWIVGQGAKAVGWAVMSYARKHRLRLRDVGYAVKAEA